MRSAMTMVELIFVIVILGILAAIAIPKLVATRDDAQIVNTAENIKTAISEITTMTLAKGALDSNITSMSQALETMVSNGTAIALGNKFNIKIGTQADCVVLDIKGPHEIILDSNITSMSQALETKESNKTAIALGNKVNNKIDAQAEPVVLDNNGSDEITVDVQYRPATDSLCQSFQDANDLDRYALKIRGESVTY